LTGSGLGIKKVVEKKNNTKPQIKEKKYGTGKKKFEHPTRNYPGYADVKNEKGKRF